MANTNLIRGNLQNFEVYDETDGSDLFLGIADVELPELEPLKTDLKGAGILGEVSSPVVGHFSDLTIGFNWRTIHRDLTELSAPYGHKITTRGAIQNYDAGTNQMVVSPVKITVNGLPSKTELGKFEPGETTESKTELTVTYLKIDVDGVTIFELDKYNYKYVVNGVDYLAATREAVGRS